MPIVPPGVLQRLPQPLHLFAAMFDAGHYHFGLFSSPRRSLEEAQEALADAVAARVHPGARVLDVGCGLGGTSRVLAQRGFATVGIDPCESAIAFAQAARDRTTSPTFTVGKFENYHEDHDAPTFDALVLVEVLQHLPPLAWTLRRALELLRPGGTLIVADVVNRTALPWERVPFHRAGSLATCARELGLSCFEHIDLTHDVVPTPTILVDALHESRRTLQARFGGRGALDDEIHELVRQCVLLDEAFCHGDLGYELVVLQRPPGA